MTVATTPASAVDPSKPVRTFYDIRGWFYWIDSQLFGALLDAQADTEPGTLVELGCYLGKSAVVIGDHLRPGEDFVVVDLFGDVSALESGDEATRKENAKSYSTLTRQQFEANYLALHDRLPTVVQAPSSEVTNHVADGTARFVHIDASHLYPHVRADVRNAQRMLRPGGVVVLDDYRSEHTPGVSAAAWEAVFALGLVPVALTPRKFYGCFTEPDVARQAVRRLVDGTDRLWGGEQEIAGHQVLRVAQQGGAKPRQDNGKKPSEAKPASANGTTAAPELSASMVEAIAARTADRVIDRMSELDPVHRLTRSVGETVRRLRRR